MSTVSIDRVINAPSLPSLPAVAMEVLELSRDPNVAIKRIAESVENDQALAMKILKTVNSSFYGLSSPCPTIVRAMSYLGLNTVKSLVLGFSLADTFLEVDVVGEEPAIPKDGPRFSLFEQWRGTLYAAAGARELASKYVHGIDSDEAFTAALLQDVGMLACAAVLQSEYGEIAAGSLPGDVKLAVREQETFGFTHLDVGHGMAERWKLPHAILDTITHHDKPADAPGEHMNLVRLVSVATRAAAAILATPEQGPEAIAREVARKAAKWFGLSEQDTGAWMNAVIDRADALARLFKLPPGGAEANRDLLAAADERLLEHQISQQRAQDDLMHQALTDGLTGVSNRKHFDMLLADSFEAALKDDGSVAVLILDADKFKSVNDTLGHQAGDAVLVQLAERVKQAVGTRGVTARYGGEEFAVVMPGLTLDEAGRVAESVRQKIEGTAFDLSDVPCVEDLLNVTASIGVCARERGMGEKITSAATLLRGADKAVYAAKEAGRNNVKMLRLAKSPPPADGSRNAGPAGATATSEPSASGEPPAAGDASPTPTLNIPAPPPELAAEERAAHDAATKPEPRPATVVASDGEAGKRHVLLVEDDRLQAKLVERPLVSSGEFAVTVAFTAAEAIEALEKTSDDPERRFAFILCDLGLPDVKGDELVKRIRASEAYRLTPIVMLSASTDSRDVALCLSAGANAFITKESICDDPKNRVLQIAEFWSSMAMAA